MQEKGNSVQITTISEGSTKKHQDMPIVIRGIVKIAEVHPMPSEDTHRSSEDFR